MENCWWENIKESPLYQFQNLLLPRCFLLHFSSVGWVIGSVGVLPTLFTDCWLSKAKTKMKMKTKKKKWISCLWFAYWLDIIFHSRIKITEWNGINSKYQNRNRRKKNRMCPTKYEIFVSSVFSCSSFEIICFNNLRMMNVLLMIFNGT